MDDAMAGFLARGSLRSRPAFPRTILSGLWPGHSPHTVAGTAQASAWKDLILIPFFPLGREAPSGVWIQVAGKVGKRSSEINALLCFDATFERVSHRFDFRNEIRRLRQLRLCISAGDNNRRAFVPPQ